MKNTFLIISMTLFSLTLMSSNMLYAAGMKSDNEHVRKWNKFAQDVLALHHKLVKLHETEKKSKVGGYFGNPEYYKEETHYHKEHGKLISRVQWERENPQLMHTIEVYVRDDEGKVLRDYAAAYLPGFRNAPNQTLISLHNYNGQLHAFRTFDASGERIVERCTGQLNGSEVNFILDEDEIYNALDGNSKRMEQADYKACFKGLQDTAGKYLSPQ